MDAASRSRCAAGLACTRTGSPAARSALRRPPAAGSLRAQPFAVACGRRTGVRVEDARQMALIGEAACQAICASGVAVERAGAQFDQSANLIPNAAIVRERKRLFARYCAHALVGLAPRRSRSRHRGPVGVRSPKWMTFDAPDAKGAVVPAQTLPKSAACFVCHTANGAVDKSFVQFYPTLLPIARAKRTLNAAV